MNRNISLIVLLVSIIVLTLVGSLTDIGIISPTKNFLWIFISGALYILIFRRVREIKKIPLVFFNITQLIFLLTLFVLWVFTFNVVTHKIVVFSMYFVSLLLFLQTFIIFSASNSNKFRVFNIFNVFNVFFKLDILYGFLTNASLIFISLFLSTMFIEQSFRVISGIKPASRKQIYEKDLARNQYLNLQPYTMFRREGDLDVEEIIKKENLSIPKKENELRIAVIGGSAAWGGGKDTSIPSFIEKYLQEYYPNKNVRVMNFGRTSYVSAQELILLERSVLPLDLDVLLIYDGYNDIGTPIENEPMGIGYPYLYSNLKERIEVSDKLINIPMMVVELSKKSSLIYYLTLVSKDVRKKENWSEFDINKCVEEYERNLFQMAVLAKAYNTKVFISVQPFVGTKDPKVGVEKDFLTEGKTKEVLNYYDQLISAAKDVANKTNSHYIDTVNIFDGINEELHVDPVHVKAITAHPIVSKYLADQMYQILSKELN